MSVVTRTVIPPQIIQYFNRHLLDPLFGLYCDVRDLILPRAKKKIRPQDVGKQREFDKLYAEFLEVYERKKAEEAEYKEKVSKAAQERPRLPNEGGTMRFKRYARN